MEAGTEGPPREAPAMVTRVNTVHPARDRRHKTAIHSHADPPGPQEVGVILDDPPGGDEPQQSEDGECRLHEGVAPAQAPLHDSIAKDA